MWYSWLTNHWFQYQLYSITTGHIEDTASCSLPSLRVDSPSIPLLLHVNSLLQKPVLIAVEPFLEAVA
jgi:hypothetical protein